MSKLYYVSHEIIAQAERMKEKYYFLMLNEMWKVQYAGQEDYPILTDDEAEKHFENAEKYMMKVDEITSALMSIVEYNRAEWTVIEVLRRAATERDILDHAVRTFRL